MIVIKSNAISSISASSAMTGYPATNLLNNSPKKKWKAADSSVTYAYIDVGVNGITGGLGLVGVIAESVFITITDPTGIIWATVVWPEVSWSSGAGISSTQVIVDDMNGYQNIWVSFTEINVPVTIRIELRKTSGTPDIISAGVLQVGAPTTIDHVVYPLDEGLEDYSIQRQLSNGATYYKRRDIVRAFSGVIRLERAKVQSFLRDVARVYGATPLMFNLAPPWGNDFIVYGRLSAMPSASHDTPSHSIISFSLIEEL